jgi:hypothetical protein
MLHINSLTIYLDFMRILGLCSTGSLVYDGPSSLHPRSHNVLSPRRQFSKFMFAAMFLRRSREYLSRSCLQPQSLQTFPPRTAYRLGSQNLCRRAKANPGYSNSGGRLMFSRYGDVYPPSRTSPYIFLSRRWRLFHLLLPIMPLSHSLQSTLHGYCWICQLREDY